MMESSVPAVDEKPAGDRQEFRAEAKRPSKHWFFAVTMILILVLGVSLAAWLIREKLREVVAEHLHSSTALDEEPAENPKHGRTFDALIPRADSRGIGLAMSDPARKTGSVPPIPTLPGLPESVLTGTASPQNVPVVPPLPSGPIPSSISPLNPVASVAVPSMMVEAAPSPAPAGPPAPPLSVASKGITSGLSAEPNAQTGPLAGAIQSTRINDTEARTLHGRDLVLARGAYIPCVLETQLVSNIAGFVSCIVTENIYSDNGHTVLIERGAHVSGEYRSDTRNGDTRLFVLWDRIKTPYGILIDVDSPGGDAVGGQGLPGYVDNHWWERIGAAFLLSSFQDVVGIAMAREAAQTSGTTINTAPTNTVGTAQDLAKEVLSSTINIPPTLFKNRGELLTIYVARDLRFDGVYRVQ